LECPRCFYLDVRRGIKRPSGFPFNLNSAVDALLKSEFDQYRIKQIAHPYMQRVGLNAVPFQHPQLDDWRNNFRGVSAIHLPTNFETFGAVDDLWLNLDRNEVIVVDYKATSRAGEITLDEAWKDGYKRQVEFYQWLLRCNGLTVSSRSWFVYCNGKKDSTAFNERLEFDAYILPYDGNDDWIEPALYKIKNCLDSDVVPSHGEGCEYCTYVETTKSL